jgi:hypothetical protein
MANVKTDADLEKSENLDSDKSADSSDSEKIVSKFTKMKENAKFTKLVEHQIEREKEINQ